MTHDDLVKFSVCYARELGFPLSIAGLVTANRSGEIPDVLAFRGGGDSLLIECKVSRSDFLRDLRKPFRQAYETGMGAYRMYVTLPNVVPQSFIDQSRWLVVEYDGAEIVKRTPFKSLAVEDERVFNVRNTRAELAYMYSYVRRGM